MTSQRWEVRTDQGWMPWAPGAEFSGVAGEQVSFVMGKVKYTAEFYSDGLGSQTNLSTGRQRRLRRVRTPSPTPSPERDTFDAVSTNPRAFLPSDSGISTEFQQESSFRSVRTTISEEEMLKSRFGIRVIKAEITNALTTSGKMNPFAVVVQKPAEGDSQELTRTRTHWGGDTKPSWEHTSEYPPSCNVHRDMVVFSVFDAPYTGLGKAIFCGSAVIGIRELLVGAKSMSEARHSKCERTELQLYRNEQMVGNITVQAIVFKDTLYTSESCKITEVDPHWFEPVITQLDVSGGTAPFYKLILRPGTAAHRGHTRSDTYYIGKDLSHASDELQFYEEALEILGQPKEGGMGLLLSFMFNYAGVLKCEIPQEKSKQLLVLENLRDGCTSLRMLDIKIGQKTAQAGWQGKSRMAALRGSLVDRMTNSSAQGFRLEGFDTPPLTITSMAPLLDLGELSKKVSIKKVFRMMFQLMCCSEVLMHFLDLHELQASFKEEMLKELRSPAEFTEIVLSEVVCRLVSLALACRDSLVPQKWIGSSIAIGFDCGCKQMRSHPEDEVRKAVRVNIFDWGRSELNTLPKHVNMSRREQRDRAEFWSYYIGGVDRLAWEVACVYWNRFGNSKRWHHVNVKIMDFDTAITRDGVLGTVSFDLRPTPETTVTLQSDALPRSSFSLTKSSSSLTNMTELPSLTYSIDHYSYPRADGTARLREGWLVRLVRATSLPRSAPGLVRAATPDPYALLTAYSDDGKEFQQQTSVVVKSFDPAWEETFEIPLAASDGLLHESFGRASLAKCSLCGMKFPLPFSGSMFPPASANVEDLKSARDAWIAGLDELGLSAGAHAQTCLCLMEDDLEVQPDDCTEVSI